jgi:hypothetical protein
VIARERYLLFDRCLVDIRLVAPSGAVAFGEDGLAGYPDPQNSLACSGAGMLSTFCRNSMDHTHQLAQ